MIELSAAGVMEGKIDVHVSRKIPNEAKDLKFGKRPELIAGIKTSEARASITNKMTFFMRYISFHEN
jgi:hypothetical protein